MKDSERLKRTSFRPPIDSNDFDEYKICIVLSEQVLINVMKRNNDRNTNQSRRIDSVQLITLYKIFILEEFTRGTFSFLRFARFI